MSKPVVTMLCMIGAFLLVVAFFVYNWLHPSVSYPRAYNGTLDARGWNFATQGVIPLYGEWEFYPGKLLTPEDFKNRPELLTERRVLKVPGGWRGGGACDEWKGRLWRALKIIRGQFPTAKIIMCSAMGQQHMVLEAIRNGAKDFIVKPFQPERVIEAVNKAVI